MSLSPGTRLGPYEIEDTAGVGGMGEVYSARDTRLDRQVAIKVLPAHFADNTDLRQRFEREAKTISGLQHPNICALYDIGREGETDYLVMEYLEGETLAERLENGPLPLEEMQRIAVQITRALDAAHRNGVVHRDLKPGNVILTRAGAKLLDFGLAKMAATSGTSTSSLTQLETEVASASLTQRGTVIGTFQYMSPEQLDGEEADARSDIFALGAVLYEMATGTKAFQGKSQAGLIAAIMNAEPQPISAIQPMTPPALDRVIRTCLEKNPEDRWQTAHDVALQLKWIQEGGSVAGVPKPVSSRRRHRERLAWGLAAVATLAALALAAAWFFAQAPAAPQATRFSIEAPDEVVSFGSPRMSPDGRTIAFNGTDESGSTQMWVRPMNSLDALPLAGTDGANRPFWSPDSRHIGFFADGRLKRVPVAGGPPITLCEFSRGADGTWGKDFILFDGFMGDSIFAVPVGGGEIRAASTLNRERGELAHGWPHFLPDGERFLFIVFSSGTGELRLGRIGSMESTLLVPGGSRVEYIEPGYLLYELNGTLLAQPFDADPGEIAGEAFALTEGIGAGPSGLAHFSGSTTGTMIFTEGDYPFRQLTWFDRRGNELSSVGEPARYESPTLSPDAKRLAVEIEDTSGDVNVWLFDLERGVQSRFTFEAANTAPVWSPDGSEIVFSSNRTGTRTLHVKRAAGTGVARLLIERPYRLIPHEWGADGRLAVDVLADGDFGVASLRVDEPDSVFVHANTSFLEAQGRFSPDGEYMAYISDETGRWEVYIIDPDSGGKWQVSNSGGTEPKWRADGRELFYVSANRELMAVDVSMGGELLLGVPSKLFDAPIPRDVNTRNRYTVTGDGERFLLVTLLDRDRVPPTNVILNWTAELRDR